MNILQGTETAPPVASQIGGDGMQKDFLSMLFYNASCDTNSFCRKDRLISNLYKHIPETNELWGVVDERLVALGVEKGSEAVCDELDALGEAREKQGFINGFRLGMMLREELLG